MFLPYDWWNEGLHGVARSGYATLFPQAIGMAATWDAPLLGNRSATVISIEARAKYNEAVRNDIHSIYFGLTIWSPNINIFRDPRWGRGQETYGEDPFLTATLGVAFVKGLQGDNPKYFRTIATPKHYAVHSGPESTRHRANIDPTPHDLWDTYLPAFRATIVDAKADSIMCAYNAIDGKPACASDLLLQDILRERLEASGLRHLRLRRHRRLLRSQGPPHLARRRTRRRRRHPRRHRHQLRQDLPRPRRRRSAKAHQRSRDRRLPQAPLPRPHADSVSSIRPTQVPYASIPFSEVHLTRAHGALALQSCARSRWCCSRTATTSCRSHPRRCKTIAVIGPNAASLSAIEGNYNAVPHDPVLPVDGIAAKFPDAKVLYAQGSPYAENAAIVIPRTQFRTAAGSTVEGLKGEYFDNDTLTGPPVPSPAPTSRSTSTGTPPRPYPAKLDPDAFSVRWTGTMQAPAAGDYEITGILAHCYPCGELRAATPSASTAKTCSAFRSHR